MRFRFNPVSVSTCIAKAAVVTVTTVVIGNDAVMSRYDAVTCRNDAAMFCCALVVMVQLGTLRYDLLL